MAREKQYSGVWKRIRREVLEAAGWRCQIRGENCLTLATECDHIRPVALGGEWFNKENLRAACTNCNRQRNKNKRTEPNYPPPSRNW